MTTMTLERSRDIPAPPEQVWEVVSDIAGYARYAPGLRATHVLSGAGRGARRYCEDTSGRSWEETCTLWEQEHRYVIDVDVTTYPARYRSLFRSFTGTWTVTPGASDGSRVTLRFDAQLRRVPGAGAVARGLARRAASDVEAILEAYERALTETSAQEPAHRA